MTLYKGFRSNLIGFGAGVIFGNMGVSDHRAEMPIKKFKKYFQLPQPGKFKCSFHKCFSIGLLLHHTFTACCFCGHLCLCLGKKRQKDKNNQPTPPSLWTEMPRRPRLLPKGFYQFCKGLCCRWERCTGRQHESTKPGLTLQYRHLLRTPNPPGKPRAYTEGLLPRRSTARDPRLCRRCNNLCVWQAQH